MRRLAAIVVALVLPGLALAQNLYPTPLDWRPWDADYASPGRSSEVMRLPLTQSGAGFDCTGAASCVSFDGSTLVDSAGLSWSMAGTVGNYTTSQLPTTASPGAAGPTWNASNAYSHGSGSDVLDTAGDRFGCVAFSPHSATTDNALVGNGTASANGYYIGFNNTGRFAFASYRAGAAAFAQTSIVTDGIPLHGFNVGCWWRTGTNIQSKVNLGSTASAAGGTEVAGTGSTLKLGIYQTGIPNFDGKLFAVVQGVGACPTPPSPFAATCEGWAVYQMKRQFGLLGSRGEEVKITRTTGRTCEVNGTIWNVPSGVVTEAAPCITPAGLAVEMATVNYALQSGTMTTGTAVTAPWALAGTPALATSAGTALDGTNESTITSSANTDALFQTTTTPSTVGPFTASVWVRSTTGTVTASLRLQLSGTPTGCTCSRSDGGACTATISGAVCYAYGSFSTTRTRLTVTATSGAALTAPVIALTPGQYLASTGAAVYSMSSLEVSSQPTSYHPALAATATRSTEVVTATIPATLAEPDWCVKVTGTPFGGLTWGLSRMLWTAGTYTATNTANAGGNGTTFFAGYAKGSDAVANYATYNAITSLTGPLTVTSRLVAPNVTATIGSAQASSFSWAGTGRIAAAPATVYLGQTHASAQLFNGWLKDWTLYRSPACR